MTAVCGPEGSEPIITIVRDIDSATVRICTELKKLNEEEIVDYSAIAILSDNREFIRKIEQTLKAAMIFYSTAKNRVLNTLTVDTIFNFKGLEAPFVFIFLDSDSGNNKELSYGATSRARTYLQIYTLNENS